MNAFVGDDGRKSEQFRTVRFQYDESLDPHPTLNDLEVFLFAVDLFSGPIHFSSLEVARTAPGADPRTSDFF